MVEFKEVSYDYIDGSPYATVFASKKSIINHILEAKENYPDLVNIIHNDEDTILAHVPKNCYVRYNKFVMPKIRDKKDKKPISEEKRLILVERMKNAREAKNKNK